jgi:hypothetical protein
LIFRNYSGGLFSQLIGATLAILSQPPDYLSSSSVLIIAIEKKAPALGTTTSMITPPQAHMLVATNAVKE